MKKLTILISIIVFVVVLISGCTQQPPKGTEVSGKTSKGDKITVDQLAKIQPGAGTMMIEIGNRWWVLYYAATGGNWGLAEYELDEAEEAMDVINVTRPNLKKDLESFLDSNKGPLEDAIKAKDTAAFKTAFDNGVKGCNSCHKEQKKDFVEWKIPSQQPPYLTTTPITK